MEKFKYWVKTNLKIILAVAIPLIVLAIIFALPIKNVSIPVTETYWTTETRSENYTDTETVTEMEPYVTTETRTETIIYNQAVGYGSWNKTFTVDRPNTTVSVGINNYGSNYNYPRYFVFSDNFSPYGPYGGGYSPFSPWYDSGWNYWGGGQALATIQISYPEQVTKTRPVTKTREVVKYRDVPTQVLKERTVIKNVRMSIWESIFR